MQNAKLIAPYPI